MRRLLLVALIAGCAEIKLPTVTVDPSSTFAAHRDRRGFVIDRLVRGRTARLRPAGWLRLPGDPTYVLESEGETLAGLWLSGSHVVVRRGKVESAPLIGEVIPSWDDNAIRLALRPAEAAGFRTDGFLRKTAGGGPDSLTRIAQTVTDVRGTYEAPVRDTPGASQGFLRVKISPYQPSPRIYDAVLPADLPPPLAAAAVTALDAEIDWIENHALDVYRGNTGGPLEQSIPLPR